MSNPSDVFSHTFTVNVPIEIKQGWGVDFFPIYDADEESEYSDRIVEVLPSVMRIASDTVKVVGAAPCVSSDGDCWVPVSDFHSSVDDSYDDTHDLRPRWFASEAAARDHESWTMNRWNNPQPWESFVAV